MHVNAEIWRIVVSDPLELESHMVVKAPTWVLGGTEPGSSERTVYVLNHCVISSVLSFKLLIKLSLK